MRANYAIRAIKTTNSSLNIRKMARNIIIQTLLLLKKEVRKSSCTSSVQCVSSFQNGAPYQPHSIIGRETFHLNNHCRKDFGLVLP